jgi:hypothetical protein
MGERRSAYRILVGRPEGRRPLGRARRRWKDNIKNGRNGIGAMDLFISLRIWTGGRLL